MRRRTFLASSALAATALAGCSERSDETVEDGYPPESGEQPTPMDVDTEAFERIEVEGEQVRLAPAEVAYNWHARRVARFADARGEGQYDRAHVTGAVWSPAPDGRRDGPVGQWPKADRIVCYCGCPHHLSSIRASSLIAAGYEEVYVIDEGFFEWRDRGYPVSGSAVETSASKRLIRGRTDARYAGEPVYASHEPTDQREAAFVGEDGGFELTLRFVGVTDESEIRVDAPDYTVVAPLSALTEAVVTAPE